MGRASCWTAAARPARSAWPASTSRPRAHPGTKTPPRLLHADFCPPHQRPTAGRGARVFPNATGKAKGERAVFVGDQLLEDRDLSSLALRRPLDRRGPAPAGPPLPWPRAAAL